MIGIGDQISLLVSLLGRIVLQKIGKHIRGSQIIDRDNLKALSLEHLAESQTANTTKTINCNSYCHNCKSSCFFIEQICELRSVSLY